VGEETGGKQEKGMRACKERGGRGAVSQSVSK